MSTETTPAADAPISRFQAVRAGYLLDTRGDPRVRRARDAVRVVMGLVLLFLSGRTAVRLSAPQLEFADLVAALPPWTEVIFWVGYGLAAAYVVLFVIVLLLRWGRNPLAAVDVLLASITAALTSAMVILWRDGELPDLLPELGRAQPELQFPIIRVAIVTAVVLALSPHVNRALRRFGGVMILLVTVSGLGLGFGYPTDALAAIGPGLVAAGGVHLAIGSPTGFPPVGVVAAAMTELGVPLRELEPALDQSWGTRRLFGFDEQGQPVQVKAYGRDAADTQLAAKLWRGLWYRDSGPAIALTRLQAVEHEALMALFASRAGVSVNEPLTAGMAGDDVAILAMPHPGTPLAELPEEELSDDLLAAIWRDVAVLHERQLAHGALTASSIHVDGGRQIIHEFAGASLAAGERVHVDVATLLVSLAQLVGSERAVRAAARGLGSDRLAASLSFVQAPALLPSQRREVTKPKAFMKELREAAAGAAGVELPPPVKLRRVSVANLVMLALVLFAVNALITQLAGIDYASVWQVVSAASFVVLGLAFFVGQLNFFFESTAMSAAVGLTFPARPLVTLQYGARFLSLAVPSAAGRVAMNTAFLVKYGVSTTKAVVQGAIDGFSGFLVEAGVLVLALIFTDKSFQLGGDFDLQLVLIIVVVLAVVAVTVAFSVRRIRELILPTLQQAWEAIRGVVTDPRRALVLLGSNLMARVALGLALWMILRAVGVGDVSIVTAIVVTVATNLLAGITPVPGGVGVAEAVMTSWLVLVGVPEAEAFAATIIFRFWTFYLPAVVGAVAIRWLERNDYL